MINILWEVDNLTKVKPGRRLKVVDEKRDDPMQCRMCNEARMDRPGNNVGFYVFTKRSELFLEFLDPGYQKNSAGGPIPMEVQRWEKEISGNRGFAVFQHVSA